MNIIDEKADLKQSEKISLTFPVGAVAVAVILLISLFRGDVYNSGVMTIFLAILSAESYSNYLSMKNKLFLFSAIVAGIGTIASLVSFIMFK